ncbi:MAG: hypothetical protein HDR16_00905 [Lachnospiraceae bacterium]|nr:hypothetical protein [Lachnospiraceae bacterium]
MISVLLFTAIVVVLIFFYMRRKARKSSAQTQNLNFMRDYHASYDRIRSRSELRDKNNGYKPYVTKYNSSEDYRERGH